MSRTLALSLALAALASLVGAAGCGRGYLPVHGKVTLSDGSPVPGCLVLFEGEPGGKKISARGEVGPDGSFNMSTNTPGDGVPPGNYRVSVVPPPPPSLDSPSSAPYNERFTRSETSGLTFEVKPGNSELSIRVSK